jgi:hypothetical protein
MTLAEHYARYAVHFGDRQTPEHAFRMGALRMLQLCRTRPETELRELAAELDRYLADDAGCLCERCKELREAGALYSLVEDLFSSKEIGHA